MGMAAEHLSFITLELPNYSSKLPTLHSNPLISVLGIGLMECLQLVIFYTGLHTPVSFCCAAADLLVRLAAHIMPQICA